MQNQTAVKQTENETSEDELTEEDRRLEQEWQIQIFGNGLQTKYNREVGLKEQIEQRWLDDLRHYNGRYDRDTEARMTGGPATGQAKSNSSRIFVNLTRAKSNVAESKWSDLVLPTDDRNYGIQPTPVPDMVKMLGDKDPLTLADGTAAVNPEKDDEPYTNSDMASAVMKEANERCEAMQTEIDDQLTEANYNAVCREIIHDAVVMGIGIIKGPMVEKRTKKAWIQNEAGQWILDIRQEIKPTAERVDPWNFFPDMSATCWKDVEFTFERHLLTRKQLRKLAKQPGYMPNQIRNILNSSPNSRTAKLSYLNELREINGITQIQTDNRYEVVEYHGPVNKSDLVACGCKGINEADPLKEFEGTVWFSMGTVIKVSLNHMDSEELPYNILNWEEDETSIFGFGVPYRMRSPQKVMNASWRMVLDNAGLSTGPQILINKSLIEPADGNWELTPRKLWYLTTNDPKFRADYAMQTFNIDSKQTELTNIFEMAHRLADEETSVPQMQMGAQPGDTQQPAMLKTLGGTALWMSSNNIMMRRAVKSFDDNITDPFITRFYDFNMQFSEKEDIKGDFSIDARGTSVLLVREMQARNMESFINIAMAIPGGPEELKVRGVLQNIAKGMQVNTDDVMRSDEDVKQAEADAKDAGPAPDLEMQKLQLQREIAQAENDRKMAEAENARQIALIQREVELTKLASQEGVDMEKIRTDAGIKKYQADFDLKKFYTELKAKKEFGKDGNYGLN